MDLLKYMLETLSVNFCLSPPCTTELWMDKYA